MNFSTKGLLLGLGELQALVAVGEKDDLYLLDKSNTRIVMLDKKGNYKRQYRWDGVGSVTDMEVIEREGKSIILLLSGSSIYEIPVDN